MLNRALLELQLNPLDDQIAAKLTDLLDGGGDLIQVARFVNRQRDLSLYEPAELLRLRQQFPTPFLNIAGGPDFLYPLWANLDSVSGPLNPTPFELSSEAIFPFENNSFELIYSSHAFDRLDTPTVRAVLSEARRVIRPDGALIIKIPDFSALLSAWSVGDDSRVDHEEWNFSAVVPTLKNRGLVDSVHTRTAYLFCGFWNPQFGHLFGKSDPTSIEAYNGPPALSDAEFHTLSQLPSPNQIAAILRQRVLETETSFTFNHQNAWSTGEFTTLLSESGFNVWSTDANKIVYRFSYIPGLRTMFDISAYFLAFSLPEAR